MPHQPKRHPAPQLRQVKAQPRRPVGSGTSKNQLHYAVKYWRTSNAMGAGLQAITS